MNKDQIKPIGWYLKEADSLITAYINSAFSDMQIIRFHWQILKAIADDGHINPNEFHPKVKEFISMAELNRLINDLTNREWVIKQSEAFEFTYKGKLAFQDIEQKQNENRRKILAGITEDEYLQTINVLTKIIANMQ